MEKRRISGSIVAEHFDCRICKKPLRPPVFQHTSSGCFVCETCRDNRMAEDNPCPACSRTRFTRSLGMESAVESLRVDCAYAIHGCPAKTTYYDMDEHEAACPNGRCFCPEPGCGGFAGRSPELWDHFVNHHGWQGKTISYFEPFDLPVHPGMHLLRGESDGQVFVVNVELRAGHLGGGEHAVSLACVRAGAAESGYGCYLSFSCFKGHHGSSTLYSVPCSTLSDGPPKSFFCVVPDAPAAGGGGVLTVTIDTEMARDAVDALVQGMEEEDDEEEGSYHEGEDDD